LDDGHKIMIGYYLNSRMRLASSFFPAAEISLPVLVLTQ
jgi:hypothetical protein